MVNVLDHQKLHNIIILVNALVSCNSSENLQSVLQKLVNLLFLFSIFDMILMSNNKPNMSISKNKEMNKLIHTW